MTCGVLGLYMNQSTMAFTKTRTNPERNVFSVEVINQANNFFTWSNFLLLSILFLLVTSFSLSSSFLLYSSVANAQPITLKDMVRYEKQSNFIKEFKIPLTERGLKGITTDTLGNAWFYHSTFNSSTILRL